MTNPPKFRTSGGFFLGSLGAAVRHVAGAAEQSDGALPVAGAGDGLMGHCLLPTAGQSDEMLPAAGGGAAAPDQRAMRPETGPSASAVTSSAVNRL